MNKKEVWLTCGIPGSGKSTWIREQLKPGSEWISRDNVRFSIIKVNEEYFSHEDEVFDTFIDYINQTLKNPDINTIYIDATHLNKNSRYKVLSKINKKNIAQLNCICFTTPLDLCIERNNLRQGRERVPETTIRNMFKSYRIPSAEEGFNHIYTINENRIIEEVTF